MNILKKILIINNDQAVSSLLKTYLSNKTIKINVAHTYLEVCTVLRTNTFDVILTDTSVNGASGFQLIETLKNATSNCKTIVITGMNQENQQTMFKEFGITIFLNFPVSLDLLITNVEQVL